MQAISRPAFVSQLNHCHHSLAKCPLQYAVVAEDFCFLLLQVQVGKKRKKKKGKQDFQKNRPKVIWEIKTFVTHTD